MMILIFFKAPAPPPSQPLTQVHAPRDLYNHHVESFSRLNDSSIAIGHCWQLLVTRDRGKTWTLSGELPERNIIKQILWIDSSDVVVNASFTGNGKIFFSSNGGRSFNLTLTSTASSESMVWDTASGILFAAENGNRFYVSHNKGRTWLRRGSLIPYMQRPHISHLCSLSAFVENGRRAFYVTTSYPGEIFQTLDTGRHWTLVFSDTSYSFREIPKLGKLSDGRFFAVSAKGIIDAPGSVLIGSRKGRHWKIVPAPEGLWGYDELPGHPGFLVAGGFSLGRNAGNAALFLTKNYGRAWTSEQVLGAALVWQIECVPPDSWLLATDHGLLELNINSLN